MKVTSSCGKYKIIYHYDNYLLLTQPAVTCSKLPIETLEQRCEICSKLTIEPPKRRHWRRFADFIVNFEHISHLCSSVSIVNFKQLNAGWTSVPFFDFDFKTYNPIHLFIVRSETFSEIFLTCMVVLEFDNFKEKTF